MTDTTQPGWERETLEKVVFASLKEQRRHRRWGILFKLLFFVYLFAILWLLWPTDNFTAANKQKTHTALIEIQGEISNNGSASADNIIDGLQNAFKDKNTKGIILRIDSPGGSPVQASTVYNEINYLRSQHKDIKIYTVCTDLCTSAAYYIASATDNIYADPNSLIGSIGVLMDGFGFVDSMQKVGVQRRLLTSGAHKGFLDPFSPIKPDDEQYAQGLLDNVHMQFIKAVKDGRGSRLKINADTFSGLVWTGSQALPLGLIDGYGDENSVARDIIKNDNVVDFTTKPSYIEQIAGKIGGSFARSIAGEAHLHLSGTW